jgi:uncharacterized SAM-binding protein YcdF (DUF218 family)
MKTGDRRLNFRESYHYRPSIARRVLHLALALAAAWFFGFLLFIAAIPGNVADRQTKTDVVVVLTGGGERLGEGFDLLSRGLAPRLYISGVAEGVTLEDLTKKVAETGGNLPNDTALKCCVTIDRAQNTFGNAVISSQWISEQRIQSIRLVTANYHMNRSLLEFRRAKSNITVVPNPVFPPEMRDPLWFLKPRVLIILGNEYHKYLVAGLRADLWSLGGILQLGTTDFRDVLQAGLGSIQGWVRRLLHHG